jgi:CHRD domain
MIGSRRAAITASLIGALLIAGVPTFAFGDGDSSHEAKAYSAAMTSDEVAAQKAKDDDEKKDAKKSDADKKSPDKKKDADKAAADKKKSDDNKKSDDKKKAEDPKKAADRKKADDDHKKKTDPAHKDDWKNKKHDDKWDRDWDHNRDRNHRRHDWDTHRHYYRYGYYGPGWYDDCGYYGPNYDGYSDNYSYYGPDGCGYEYGGYRSHMLVDMSWDQVIPDPNAGGYPARDAYGTGNLDIDVAAGTICYRLAYDGIDRAIGAQIHPGRPGEVGPAILLFHVGENGDDGCVGADPGLLSEIQNNPSGYYLEVNDQEHGQAMRGQLDEPDYRNRY